MRLLYIDMKQHHFVTSFTKTCEALKEPAHVKQIKCGNEYICVSYDSNYCPNCGMELL
jgi:hypothetical protein